MASLRESAVRFVGAHRYFKMLNLYPPYVGAGIRVTHCDITDEEGIVIARVEKRLYVRVKPRHP
jgi:hypothetical protein